MKISSTGLSVIKKFEGCRLTAYKCPAGVWTIGYGHTGGVKEGMTITQAQANAYLQADVAWAEEAVNKYMDTYKWNQNQFDALVSFTFNCGAGNLKTLLRDGCRTIAEISEKIPAYNQANGEVLPGLERRRAEERMLFDKGINSVTLAKKTVDELAHEVLEGRHGDDDERVRSLGDMYDAVQERVNEILASGQKESQETAEPAEATYTLTMRVLKRGCSGEDVKALQILLKGRGCNGNMYAPDGEFGPNTEGAVELYQEIHGLDVDGIAGPDTMGCLLGL